MLGESQLNVYILGADLAPRQRQRIQAQVQTALRSIPAWSFDLLRRRIEELGVPNLPLIIEPQVKANAGPQVLSLGQVEARPAVRLMPRLLEDGVDWGQDQRYLLAKAIAYMASPPQLQSSFWSAWTDVVANDNLREEAAQTGEQWTDTTDLGLLVEMFAAYVLNPQHSRWSELPAVRAFLESWRESAARPLGDRRGD